MLKISSRNKTRLKTRRIGGPIHSERLGVLQVADAPDEDVLHPRYHILFGDLALDDPGVVRLPPVLVGQVDPVLDGLYQPAAEADSHYAAGQPIHLRPLQVF
jgi:hypothetical protein